MAQLTMVEALNKALDEAVRKDKLDVLGLLDLANDIVTYGAMGL